MPDLPSITWDQARAIATGALGRSYHDREERAALASLIEQVHHHDTRPEVCTVWDGRCCDCPHVDFCPFGRSA